MLITSGETGGTAPPLSIKLRRSDQLVINPGRREKLIDFIKKLQSDDNPVLRMVYLKKPV